MRGLSPSEKLVLLALANFANERMQCWPSQERLAADTELSARTVWAALKSLEDRHMLSRTSRKRADGTRTTDIFTLHFSLEVWSEPVANSATRTRNPCEDHSQSLQEPVAAVARLTTFEPSVNHQIEPSSLVAQSAPAPKRPSKRVPESWSPTERTFAMLAEEGHDAGALERALTRMRDHEFKSARSDWDAAFRNWVRTDADRKPANVQRHPNQSPSPREDRLGRMLRGAMAAVDERTTGLD